jgi:uncharacterized protein YndB with AHSA1/START domain
MAKPNTAAAGPAEVEIVLTRVFNAPRLHIFETWTSPQHLMRWWGPAGFSVPAWDADFRPGGKYRYCLRSPDGRDYWAEGVYREIVAPERLVFTATLDDEHGNREILTTVTFMEQGAGKTRITVHQSFTESQMTRGSLQGWAQSLDRFGEYLATVS